MQPEAPQKPLYTWTDVWTMAVTRPTVDTFHTLLQDPLVTWTRAVMWLFLTGMISAVVAFNALVSNPNFQAALAQMSAEAGIADGVSGGALLSAACIVAPFAASFSVFGFFALAWVIHMVAQRMAGVPFSGVFLRLFYCIAAISAPISLLSALVAILPPLGFLGFVLLGYQAYLYVLAVRAIYGLQGSASVIAVLAPAGLFLLLQLSLVGNVLFG